MYHLRITLETIEVMWKTNGTRHWHSIKFCSVFLCKNSNEIYITGFQKKTFGFILLGMA